MANQRPCRLGGGVDPGGRHAGAGPIGEDRRDYPLIFILLGDGLVDGSGMCTVRLHVRRARSLQFEFCLVNFAKKNLACIEY